MAAQSRATARPGVGVVAVATLALVAACGGTATPAPGSVTPSAARPSASKTPTAAPTPAPSTAAIRAFVALVTKDGFSYQATFTGRSRHTTTILPISNGLLQVSGDNVLVRGTFRYEDGARYTVEHRYVGGKGWIRYDPSLAWERVPVRPADAMGAFVSVKAAQDVTYLETVTSNGKTLFRVEIRSAIVQPVMIPAANLSDTSLTHPTLTLLIDGQGRPVRGTAEIIGKGRVSGQLQEIVIDLTIAFTKVGQAVAIKAP